MVRLLVDSLRRLRGRVRMRSNSIDGRLNTTKGDSDVNNLSSAFRRSSSTDQCLQQVSLIETQENISETANSLS